MPNNCENASSTSGLMANPQLNQSMAPETRFASTDRAVVVGLYGIPGSGKTFLLKQLKQELKQEDFAFYEGSEMIAAFVPGGLNRFQKLEEQKKVYWRQLAINTIGKECTNSGQVAVVVGHFMFWSEDEKLDGQCTHRMTYPYSRIYFTWTYLPRSSSNVVWTTRKEVVRLHRPRIYAGGSRPKKPSYAVSAAIIAFFLTLLRDFRYYTEKHNLAHAESRLDEVFVAGKGQLETVLVINADRTLAAEDTGTLF
ncbi:hypothetical protein MMC30_008482 [Trapelia coarctata]|nr:hypothetical protein [Trapelia coarctata]